MSRSSLARKSGFTVSTSPVSIQSLESRIVLSFVFVSNTDDSGEGSLREALTQVSTNHLTTIQFLGDGVQTINLLSPLPAINGQVDIQGLTDAAGDPLIVINGQNAGSGATGLVFSRNTPGNTQPSQVSGLVVENFSGDGIDIGGDAPTDIFGCRIGTDATGKKNRGNGGDGIGIFNGDNQIGMPVAGAAYQNVISGNAGDGIFIGSGADSDVIQNNMIGTDVLGRIAIPNDGAGIVTAADFTTIGGTRPDAGNVISGNQRSGIQGSGTNEQIYNDLIGVNLKDNAAIPNRGDGISLTNGDDSEIGELAQAAQCTIAGNRGNGITLIGGTGITIKENNIGVFEIPDTGLGGGGEVIDGITVRHDDSTDGALGNGGDGIELIDTQQAELDDNIIGANGGNGVDINSDGSPSTLNDMFDNFIGVSIDGTAVGNHLNGLLIDDSSANFVETNSIDNNREEGVEVSGENATANQITQNGIFNNGELGIDLGTDGDLPLAGHGTTAAAGPNDLQNAPVVTHVDNGPKRGHISGTLTALPNTEYLVELFGSEAADDSLFGEGESFIGSQTLNTNAQGVGSFTLTTTGINYSNFVTGTATLDNPNPTDTSEFSQAVAVPPNITGTVFIDSNGNGKRDSGEKPLKGVVVYLDLNNDGQLDDFEPTFTSDAHGNFSFPDVLQSKVHIRTTGKKKYTVTTPKGGGETLTVGTSVVTGVLFGLEPS